MMISKKTLKARYSIIFCYKQENLCTYFGLLLTTIFFDNCNVLNMNTLSFLLVSSNNANHRVVRYFLLTPQS